MQVSLYFLVGKKKKYIIIYVFLFSLFFLYKFYYTFSWVQQ